MYDTLGEIQSFESIPWSLLILLKPTVEHVDIYYKMQIEGKKGIWFQSKDEVIKEKQFLKDIKYADIFKNIQELKNIISQNYKKVKNVELKLFNISLIISDECQNEGEYLNNIINLFKNEKENINIYWYLCREEVLKQFLM